MSVIAAATKVITIYRQHYNDQPAYIINDILANYPVM